MPRLIRRPPASVRLATRAIVAEVLECRRVFSVVAVGPLPAASGAAGSTATVDLSPYFDETTATFLKFSTEVGDYRVQLFDAQKPATVQNFLSYVTAGRLDGTLVHRVDVLSGDSTPANTAITTPPEIIQGGGFKFPGFGAVTTNAPVANEAQTNGVISNTRGTIAMARTSDPNSATSQWFVNTTDNAALDPGGFSADGYAVFGKVVPSDMTVVDQIGAVPRYPFGSPFSTLPLRNFSQTDFDQHLTPTVDNVITTQVSKIGDVVAQVMTVTAVSSDPSVVAATVQDGALKLTYGGGAGSATVTLTATSLDGQSSVQSAFTATATADTSFAVTLGGASGNKSATFTDADGTVTTVSYKGAGQAALQFAGTGLAQAGAGKVSVTGTITGLDAINLTGSDAGTVVTVATKGGDGVSVLGSLTADGPVKSITGKGTVLTGPLTVGGTVGSLALGAAINGSITLGGTAADKATTLAFIQLADTAISSGTAIKSLKVGSAANDNASLDESITAPSISAVASAGNFGTDLTIAGGGSLGSLKVGGNLTGSVTAGSIGSISVRGAVNGSVVTATQAAGAGLKSFAVTGGVSGTTVNSAGDIASVSVGSITGGSHLVAGATALGAALPTSTADFTSQAVIKSLKVKTAFSGTTVVASTIKTVKVGTLTVANGGVPFGFAADKVGTITGRSDSDKKFAVRSPADQTAANNQLNDLGGSGDFVVLVL